MPTKIQTLRAERQEQMRAAASVNEKNPGSWKDKPEVQKAIDEARTLDSRLHDLIAESCGNGFLAKELGRLKLLFRTFRDAAWDRRSTEKDLLRFAEEAREHLAIVEALQAGDAHAASQAMAKHIRSGVKYWSRGLPKE